MRAGHPFARAPTLDRYCEMRHLVVSLTGDPYGFVDEALAEHGRSRRVALTVPNFMMALAVIAETDLIAALPRQLVAMHAARFGVVSTQAPLPLPSFSDPRDRPQGRHDGCGLGLAIRGDAGRRPHQPSCSQKTACKLRKPTKSTKSNLCMGLRWSAGGRKR